MKRKVDEIDKNLKENAEQNGDRCWDGVNTTPSYCDKSLGWKWDEK